MLTYQKDRWLFKFHLGQNYAFTELQDENVDLEVRFDVKQGVKCLTTEPRETQ